MYHGKATLYAKSNKAYISPLVSVCTQGSSLNNLQPENLFKHKALNDYMLAKLNEDPDFLQIIFSSESIFNVSGKSTDMTATYGVLRIHIF